MKNIIGAWRIIESPKDSDFGLPKTHWLIGPTRIKVCYPDNEPEIFTFSYQFEGEKNFINLTSIHGTFYGLYEKEDSLLFISFMRTPGVRPPRFASDCGLMFGFEIDNSLSVPEEANWPPEKLFDSEFGEFKQHPWSSDYYCEVTLTNQNCELSVGSSLVPTDQVLNLTKRLLPWVEGAYSELTLKVAEIVAEWVYYEEEEWGIEQIKLLLPTLSLISIRVKDYNASLHFGTTEEIDHNIVVNLKFRELEIDIISVHTYG